jgi:phosphoglycerol transferase MdoB-like AlkP superfamily enzyme
VSLATKAVTRSVLNNDTPSANTPVNSSPSRPTVRPGSWRDGLSNLALTLAYAGAYVMFAWWLDRRMLGVAVDAYAGWATWVNALPGLLAALGLLAVSRRPGFSFLVVAAVQALIYRVSAIKLSILGAPVGMQDLYFVTSFNSASLAVLGGYVERPLLLGALVVLALAVLGLVWWREQPAFRWFRPLQLALMLSVGTLTYALVTVGQPWRDIYNADNLRPSRFDIMPAVLHGGLMASLVYTHNRNQQTFQAVDEAALSRLLDAVPPRSSAAGPDPVRPDIVVVLSESLFDPRILQGMTDLPDTIPHMRALLESGRGGVMAVPAYGGGTVRTEFEVLTGMPMAAFPTAEYPYVTLVRDHIPSLVSQLERHGYRTTAIHGNAGSFWNRTNTYKAIGFDKFITKSEFPKGSKLDGRYLSDQGMTDLIIRELQQEKAPTFVFALSMQAHGPYNDQKTTHREQRDAIQVPPQLQGVEALELRNYLYHIGRADQELGRLVEQLRARKRPTVLLFFGDHLPALRRVYKALGFVNTTPAHKQLVPWVMLRTDKPGQGPSGRKESWMLGGNLLDLAGLGDDRYFSMTADYDHARSELPKGRQRQLDDGLHAAAAARLNGTLDTATQAATTGTAR